MVAYGRLKTKKNFKLLALKVVAAACGRWPLTKDCKYSDLTGETFGMLENWSLRRGGRNQRFDRSCEFFQECRRSIGNVKLYALYPSQNVYIQQCTVKLTPNGTHWPTVKFLYQL